MNYTNLSRDPFGLVGEVTERWWRGFRLIFTDLLEEQDCLLNNRTSKFTSRTKVE